MEPENEDAGAERSEAPAMPRQRHQERKMNHLNAEALKQGWTVRSSLFHIQILQRTYVFIYP